ncbi:hypothetical protein PCASD_26134 [Puccinia coronata f. sp. avenae]|uniref:Uncharacterized protein n=1 Tax=Puccinia coronata f. sp. avenae TaxID=200324 RepID=A0A2N5TLE6_9BASI|nr:hypothetical protein PCASD_26134 [Puccinia coronata f. sp. avenae]
MIDPTDISFFNTQNSEFLPSSQHIQNLLDCVEKYSLPNDDGQVTCEKVYYDPEPPKATSSKPQPNKATPLDATGSTPGLRHKVAACRCIICCIKAPRVANSAILKSAVGHQTQAHSSHVPPKIPSIKVTPLPSDLVVIASLHYELICWYHEMQWRHTHCGILLDSPEATESFWEYVDRTHNYEHFNIFLLGIPLKEQNEEYHRLVDIYTVTPNYYF